MASSPAGSLEYSCPRQRSAQSQAHTLPPANQPASPPACLPAAACRCPPAGAGKGSHCSRALPPSSLSLTSFCSACAKPIWNCLNPNIQPPPPSSQIPPQFKTSPSLAPGGGEGEERGEGWRRAQEEGEGGSSFLFNFWRGREGISLWPSLNLGTFFPLMRSGLGFPGLCA